MGSNTIFPKVSIIIPTYNKSALAIETLNSIASQSYDNWECIIVDDGSTTEDFTALESFAKLDKRFSLFKRPSNTKKGANACRNYGLSISKGDYIQFFDSDDLMMSTCIENRVKAIQFSDYDFVVYCMALIYGEKKVLDNDLYFVSNWEQALKAFLGPKKLPWNLQRTLFKSNLIKNKIYFNEDMRRFQDIEFNIKMLVSCKPKFKMVEVFDCYYRFVSQKNQRVSEFNLDVFQSIPEFLKSVTSLIKPKDFKEFKVDFQERIYVYISLYTVKSIPFYQFRKVIIASTKYLEISCFQKFILLCLFYGKKYLNKIKGKSLYFKTLKKLYT